MVSKRKEKKYAKRRIEENVKADRTGDYKEYDRYTKKLFHPHIETFGGGVIVKPRKNVKVTW